MLSIQTEFNEEELKMSNKRRDTEKRVVRAYIEMRYNQHSPALKKNQSDFNISHL